MKKIQEEDESDAINAFEESDYHLILYNQAIITYQLKQYSNALALLEELFQNIEPIEENLTIRICFLMIEVCINLKLKDKANMLINYLEKAFPMQCKLPVPQNVLQVATNNSDSLSISNDDQQKFAK